MIEAGASSTRALERMVLFSDGVFAIAITLLVIDIRVPPLTRHASDMDFWWALVRLIPNFIGYGLSFAVIGAFWAAHHRSLLLASRYSPRVLPWNLALLGAIAFIPFVTAFMSAFSGLRVPTLVYCAWILVTALLNMKLVGIVTGPDMVDPEVGPGEAAAVVRRSYSVALGAASAAVVSLVEPLFAQAALVSIPLWRYALGYLAQRGVLTG